MYYGDKFHAKENERQYKQYLSCGYTGEFTVNEHGWCRNEIDRDKAERLDVFRKDRIYAYIDVVHLPNGKWVAGSSVSMPTYGYGHGVSIWCKQHDTKQEAVESHLKRIEDYIEKKDLTTYIRNAIEACRKSLVPPLEIALF